MRIYTATTVIKVKDMNIAAHANWDAILTLRTILGKPVKEIQHDWTGKWPVHLRIYIHGQKGTDEDVPRHELITELTPKAVLAIVRRTKAPPELFRYKCSLSNVVEKRRRLYLDVIIDARVRDGEYRTPADDLAVLIIMTALLTVTETDYGY